MNTPPIEMVLVQCKPCVVCGKVGILEVPKAGYDRWMAGAYVQVAFPEIPAPHREMLVSGTHPDCWKILWQDG